ncbi:hypothetical protein QOZ80_5BG0443800 [Eleusine coracana subsp. coracana]|nr:hypothetical protein QOZ80_5BG0443800 [Eleusine coracana subsp. coracana]
MEEGHSPCLGAFLLDSDETGTTPADMSNFRVLCLRLVGDVENLTTTFRASAREDRWIVLNSVVLDEDIAFLFQVSAWDEPFKSKGCVGRFGKSIFLHTRGSNNILRVNEITGALSTLTLPPDPTEELGDIDFTDDRWKLRVIGRDDGNHVLRVVRIIDEDLEVLRLGEAGVEFVLEKRVGLSQLCNVEYEPGRPWHFLQTGGRAVAPECVVLSPRKTSMWMFRVDLESMEVQRVQKKNEHHRPVFSYELPWPLTLKACL